MGSSSNIKFGDPPVVETVVSLQFAPLEGFSTAHAGWYWKTRLGKEWVKANDAPRLEDHFERFGTDRVWGPAGGMLIRQDTGPERTQIIDQHDERMIQVQDSRFIYNWRKRQKLYPTYDKLSPEFRQHFSAFQGFVTDAGLGNVKVNQWEITYVNHIPRGELWDTPTDWPKIIPDLRFLTIASGGPQPEDFGGEWHSILPSQRGRLHVSLRHAKVLRDGPEVLALQLLARGPVDQDKGVHWESGVDLGHEAIITTFVAVTSSIAHRRWERQP